MGVGLLLRGKAKPAGMFAALSLKPSIEKVEKWAQELRLALGVGVQRDEDPAGLPRLLLQLHPAAEPVEIVELEKRILQLSAKTSTVGPGYHVLLCELARELAEAMSVDWFEDVNSVDEAGFLTGGDKSDVQTAMAGWLKSTAEVILQKADDGMTNIAVSLPQDVSYSSDGMITTPMGPRSRDWVEAAARDGLLGRDIFPWWDPDNMSECLFGAALTRMWTEVRWNKPLGDREERDLQDILALLTTAHQLDPTLPFPWREWQELIDLLELRKFPMGVMIARNAAESPDREPIGYRRRDVAYSFTGGWRINIPGSFAVDDGDHWTAFDGECSVHFTVFDLRSKTGEPVAPFDALRSVASEPAGESIAFPEDGRILGKAHITPDDDNPSRFTLSGATAVTGSLALTTIEFPGQKKEWAVQTWQTLKNAQFA